MKVIVNPEDAAIFRDLLTQYLPDHEEEIAPEVPVVKEVATIAAGTTARATAPTKPAEPPKPKEQPKFF